MTKRGQILRRIGLVFLSIAVAYLAIGVAFHVSWRRTQAACSAERAERGELVEPEVFSGALRLVFDVTFWPAYVWANVRHFGDPFSTSCVHTFSSETNRIVGAQTT